MVADSENSGQFYTLFSSHDSPGSVSIWKSKFTIGFGYVGKNLSQISMCDNMDAGQLGSLNTLLNTSDIIAVSLTLLSKNILNLSPGTDLKYLK